MAGATAVVVMWPVPQPLHIHLSLLVSDIISPSLGSQRRCISLTTVPFPHPADDGESCGEHREHHKGLFLDVRLRPIHVALVGVCPSGTQNLLDLRDIMGGENCIDRQRRIGEHRTGRTTWLHLKSERRQGRSRLCLKGHGETSGGRRVQGWQRLMDWRRVIPDEELAWSLQ